MEKEYGMKTLMHIELISAIENRDGMAVIIYRDEPWPLDISFISAIKKYAESVDAYRDVVAYET